MAIFDFRFRGILGQKNTPKSNTFHGDDSFLGWRFYTHLRFGRFEVLIISSQWLAPELSIELRRDAKLLPVERMNYLVSHAIIFTVSIVDCNVCLVSCHSKRLRHVLEEAETLP